MLSTIIPLALAASSVSAASIASRQAPDTCSLLKELATFDDVSYTPALPILNTIDTYKGLEYKGFAGVNTQLADVMLEFVDPPSSPNVIVTGLEQTLLGGGEKASFSSTNGDLRPYFNFHGLNGGCFLNTVASAVNIPVKCDITFTSFLNGTQKGTKTVSYTPNYNISLAVLGNGNVPTLPGVPTLPIGKRQTDVIPVASEPLTAFPIDDPLFCDIDTVEIELASAAVTLPGLGDILGGASPIPSLPALPVPRQLGVPTILVAAAFDNLNYTLHCNTTAAAATPPANTTAAARSKGFTSALPL